MKTFMFINKRAFFDVKGSKGLQEIMYEGGMASGVIDLRVIGSPYLDESIKERIRAFDEKEPDVLKLKLLQHRDIYFMAINKDSMYNVQAKQYVLPNENEPFNDDIVKEV